MLFRSATNTIPWITLYCGHGYNQGMGAPFYFDNFHVEQSLANSSFPYLPFGFGFACLMNNNLSNDCFGKVFTCKTDNGGISYYASTTLSYKNGNNKLSSQVFKQIYDRRYNLHLGHIITHGASKYYSACETSYLKKRQIKRYVLFGDPSTYIYGLNMNSGNPGNYAPQHKEEEDGDDVLGITPVGLS